MQELEITERHITPMQAQAELIEISDVTTMEQATAFLSNANKYLDSVIAYKEGKTKPLNQALKVIRAETKPYEEALESIISTIRGKMSQYQTRITNERLEAELAISARIGEGRGFLKAETAVAKIENLPKAEQKVETTAGSITFIATPRFEVTDLGLVPLEYHLANEVEIRKAMKEGVELPGVRYFIEQVPRNQR